MTDEKTFEVTGTLNPDATGIYEDGGEHNGKRYYELVGNGWYLFWDGVDSWRIDDILGDVDTAFWFRTDPAIEGDYDPWGYYVGVATVTEI